MHLGLSLNVEKIVNMKKGIGPQGLGASKASYKSGKSPLKRSDKVARQNYKPSEQDKADYASYKASGGKGDIYQAYRVGFKSPDQSREVLSTTGSGQLGGVASRKA
jgi:hypothetical protein